MKNRTILLLLLGLLLLTACGPRAGEGDALDLTGAWKLAALGGQAPLAGSTVTLLFEEDRVGGNAGCNSYGGDYQIDGSSIQFGALAQTEMACMEPEGLMEQESAYLQALSQTASLKQDGSTLELLDSSGATLLTFQR